MLFRSRLGREIEKEKVKVEWLLRSLEDSSTMDGSLTREKIPDGRARCILMHNDKKGMNTIA